MSNKYPAIVAMATGLCLVAGAAIGYTAGWNRAADAYEDKRLEPNRPSQLSYPPIQWPPNGKWSCAVETDERGRRWESCDRVEGLQ